MGNPVYESAPNHSGVFVDPRDAEQLLRQYSEWLDSEFQGALGDDGVGGDRTYGDLVHQFIASRDVYAVPMLGEPLPPQPWVIYKDDQSSQ